MSRPKRLNPNSFSHFITAQLFAGAHQGVFHRFGGAVQQLGCLGGSVPLQTGKQTAAFQGRKLRVDAFQHGGAALVGNGKLFRPRRGRIFRQGHTVVQRSMLFAGGTAAGILLCVGNTGCGIRGKGDFFIRPLDANGM